MFTLLLYSVSTVFCFYIFSYYFFTISYHLLLSSILYQLTAATSLLVLPFCLVFLSFFPSSLSRHNRCYNLQQIVNSSKSKFHDPLTYIHPPSHSSISLFFHLTSLSFPPSSLQPSSLSNVCCCDVRQRSQERVTQNDKAIRRKWEQFRIDRDTRRRDIQRGYASFLPTLSAHNFSTLFSLILWKWQSSSKIYGPSNSYTTSQLDKSLLFFPKRRALRKILQFNCVTKHFCWQLSETLLYANTVACHVMSWH